MARQRNATPTLHHYVDRLPRAKGAGRATIGSAAAGQVAADMLVLDNLGLVVVIARRYWFDGIALDDLIQAGNLGLLRAARRYDPERGTSLASWLSFGIRQAMLEHLAGHQHVVALPRNLHLGLVRASQQAQSQGRGPRRRARPAPLDLERFRGVSIQGHGAEGDAEEATAWLPPQPDDAPAAAERAAMAAEIASLLDVLDGPARKLVIERFGLDGTTPCGTMAQAARGGVSREAIRLRYNAAMARLAVEAEARGLHHWLEPESGPSPDRAAAPRPSG